jgi:uncharacterized protein (TIGR03435 family)
MMEEAFHVQPFQIAGGPSWTQDALYSVEAKPPASSPSAKSNPPYPKAAPNDEQRRMLQALLIDRFHLKLHRETREGPVYLLMRGRKPLKLEPTRDPNEYPWAGSLAGAGFGGDGMRGTNITMTQLAERLGLRLERPVIDQTGLTGAYDFRIAYASDGERPDLIASIITSVRNLGLKLEAGKGPIETIVIDRAEKPAAN